MTHARQNKTFTIKMLNNGPQMPYGGGLIIEEQVLPNAADNKGDGLLMIDDENFLLVD